jgi:hypothetical protein
LKKEDLCLKPKEFELDEKTFSPEKLVFNVSYKRGKKKNERRKFEPCVVEGGKVCMNKSLDISTKNAFILCSHL